MGILDDAIREHLDLKRRLGAAQDELQRLEDEAFGPPSRPGDPDFPERAEGADGLSTSEFAARTQTAEAPGSPPEERPFEAGEAEQAPFDAAAGKDDSPETEAAAAEAPPTAESPVAEPVAEPEPVPEVPPAPEPEPPPAPEPPAEPPAAPADEGSSELDLDLDLDLEDEAADVVEPKSGEEDVLGDLPGTDEQPLLGEVEPAPEPEAPIESLDTVEHHFDEAIDDAEVVEEAEKEPAPGAASSEEEASEDKASEDEEDVLEETPEFLRDNPDDDELWFEQGEPKDFDF